MKEHIILLDNMADRLGWLEDRDCHQQRLEELKKERVQTDSPYKSNPFTYG